MKCKHCGTELIQGTKFCTNCGTAVEYQKAEAKNGSSKSKIRDIALYSGAAILLLLILIFRLARPGGSVSSTASPSTTSQTADVRLQSPQNPTPEPTDTVLVLPGNMDKYIGIQRINVVTEFRTAGFKNIKEIKLEDISINNPYTEGAVESVLINGRADYIQGEQCSEDTEIVIAYHTPSLLNPPISSLDTQTLEWEEIKDVFTRAGFSNISITRKDDYDPDEDSSPFKNIVTVNGSQSFNTTQTVPFNTPIIIEYSFPYEKYDVSVFIDFIPNIIFARYNVNVNLDEEKLGTINHGDDYVINLRLKEGTYTLTFSNSNSSSVSGTLTLQVNCDIEAKYQLICYSDHVNLDEVYVDYLTELEENQVRMTEKEYYFLYENYSWVASYFENLGFTNITLIPKYDIIWGITETGSVSDVTIGGSDDFQRGNIFDKDIEVIITYSMPYDQDPARPTPTPSPSPTPTPEPTPERPVSYSTNGPSMVKNGNSGVYAYIRSGEYYDLYYIIDFDEGYTYYFTDRNQEDWCDRVKIVSGDLNSVLIITYNDGGSKWSYGLHFKWKNQPDHLILQNEDGDEFDFYTTNLNAALRLLDTKEITDYSSR